MENLQLHEPSTGGALSLHRAASCSHDRCRPSSTNCPLNQCWEGVEAMRAWPMDEGNDELSDVEPAAWNRGMPLM